MQGVSPPGSPRADTRDPETAAGVLSAEHLACVESVLRRHVRGHTELLDGIHRDITPLTTYLEEAMTGGKRLRAAFCLWGARGATAGDIPSGAPETAAAIELFHLAALIHDDVMDHSDQRRGLPTVHRYFADRYAPARPYGDAEDFGEAIAILAGDLCLTWSDDLLTEGLSDLPRAIRKRTRSVWSTMRDETIGGQYLDVLGQTQSMTSLHRARLVLRFKSAKYTVAHPLQLGGALGGADNDLISRYEHLGLIAGEAFQLRDDMLGVFGDSVTTGKPIVDDIREGKRTLLVAVATERADPAQRRHLARHLGNPDLTYADLEQVAQIFRDTGAADHVETRIADLATAAIGAVHDLPVDDLTRTALGNLIDRCVWRTS